MSEALARHVANCSFDKWYPLFRRQTIESRVVPLTHEFLQFLADDSVVLPAFLTPGGSAGAASVGGIGSGAQTSSASTSSESDGEDSDDDDNDDDPSLDDEARILALQRKLDALKASGGAKPSFDDAAAGSKSNAKSKHSSNTKNSSSSQQQSKNTKHTSAFGMDRASFFPTILDQIEKELASLDNKAFVKLNWSAPNDAQWIATGKQAHSRVTHKHF